MPPNSQSRSDRTDPPPPSDASPPGGNRAEAISAEDQKTGVPGRPRIAAGFLVGAVLSATIGAAAQSFWTAPEQYVWQSEPRDTVLREGNRGLLITVVNLTNRQISEPLSWTYQRKRQGPERCRNLPFAGPAIITPNVRVRVMESDPYAGILTVQPLLPGAHERFGVKTRGVAASECFVLEQVNVAGVEITQSPFFWAWLRVHPLLLAGSVALITFMVLGVAALARPALLARLFPEKQP